MSRQNQYVTTLKVIRCGKELEIEVHGDLCGDLVAVNKIIYGEKVFALDDNEVSAARCQILEQVYPKQGWDKRAANLLRIARQFPGT